MISFLTKVMTKLSQIRLNPIATFIVNFKMCSWKDARKFPILIYGKMNYARIDGNIDFPNGCYCGMVTIGKNLGYFGAPKSGTYLCMFQDSKMIFRGKAAFAIDVNIRLTKNAVVEFGNDVRIGDSVNLYCESRVCIGDNTRITFGSQICDTNFHYMEDVCTGLVHNRYKPIFIGANNWIGNHSRIGKGCFTPDWCIVASGSLANKDYRSEGENTILAGNPAKVIKNNIKRIFDLKTEQKIDEHFKNSKDPFDCKEFINDEKK